MLGGISLYGIVNLVVVVAVLVLFYILFILVQENGGYRHNRRPIVGVTTTIVFISTIVSVSIYSHSLQSISDKIDSVSTVVDEFPDKIKDCANASSVADTFNHYGIQATSRIAGKDLKIYEDIIVTLLFVLTILPTVTFLLSSNPFFILSTRTRWRLFWFGMFQTLILGIICFIVMIFYDLLANAQLVMKSAGGIVGEALESCDSYWASLIIFMESPVTQQCADEVKVEMCKVRDSLLGYTGTNLLPFQAVSMTVAYIIPFSLVALASAVYFTWDKTMINKADLDEDGEETLVFRTKRGRSSKTGDKLISLTDW
jgi:hypothetical protein